eukprot:Skav229428  [mRNA]  locus=scaffold2297:359455:361740:- [translate_table: standard]
MDYISKARQPHLTLDNRARLCSYAITKALWGTESYVVGQSWFQALRSAVAKTLVLDKGHSNSNVACMLLSKFVIDPELYHIKQCVRTCRNMLVSVPCEQQRNFFRVVSRHTTRHHEVWGPAGALAYNLSKLSWSLTADGVIHTDTLISYHLLHSSQEHLWDALEQAWLRHMVQCQLHRPEWTNLPVPDRRATIHCIAQAPQEQHKTIAQAITGSSMLASQIQHFGDTTENCALCDLPDSYVHRTLECTATADVARFAATNQVPDSFQVAMVAPTFGKQSIPRAELQAALAVATLNVPAALWTDSQYVCDVVRLLKITSDPVVLHTRRNYDVLRILWNHVRRPDFQVHKIKAHSLNLREDTHVDTWHKLGNHAADLAAKQFLHHLHRTYPLNLASDHLDTQTHRCKAWYTYLHQLQIDRAKLFQQLPVPLPVGNRHATWTEQYASLQTWVPHNSWAFSNDPEYQDLLQYCVWGSQYSNLLLSWFALLQWPDGDDACDPYGLGVTWSELALSFLISTQFGIIVNRGGQHADFRPEIVPPNVPQVVWSIQVASFERAVRSLQAKIPVPMFPDNRTLAKSYKVLGGDLCKHGLSTRPSFPHQSQVVTSLTDFIAQERVQDAIVHVPTVPQLTPLVTSEPFALDAADERNGWNERINRARRHRQA